MNNERIFVRAVAHTETITVEGLIADGFSPVEAKKYAGGPPKYRGLTVVTEAEIREFVHDIFEEGDTDVRDMFHEGAKEEDVSLEEALDMMSWIHVDEAVFFRYHVITWIEITEEVKC